MPEVRPDGAFVDASGAPQLLRCVVLFLDILGVSDMALDHARRDRNLVELDRALRRSTRDFLSEDSPWPSALLSDALVVADATGPSFDDVMALNEMLIQTALLQLQLASHGFFARGAISIGPHHVHDGMVFGPALVEAYRLESQRALTPRVILSPEACKILRADMKEVTAPDETTQADLLRVDQDGIVFIDYLKVLLDEVDPIDDLSKHRSLVEAKLAETKNESRKWGKYRWVAEYHNDFCERLGRDELCIVSRDASPGFQEFGLSQNAADAGR